MRESNTVIQISLRVNRDFGLNTPFKHSFQYESTCKVQNKANEFAENTAKSFCSPTLYSASQHPQESTITASLVDLRYIDTVFEKKEIVIGICLKFQNLLKDLF